MKITMPMIRARYPDPVSARDGDTAATYCVGGAVARFAWEYRGLNILVRHFPESRDLAPILMLLNPQLGQWMSLNYASRITRANDSQDLEGAWGLLDKALTYGKTTDAP